VDHPEGLAIDPDAVVWCGGEEGQIYRAPLRDAPKQIAAVPGRPLGFALDDRGDAYCCVYLQSSGLYRITRDGDVRLVSAGTEDRPAQIPNHPAFLPCGRLVFTDSGEWGQASGCIYAVDADGGTTVVDSSCAEFPNGLAVAPDGKTLAVVESTLPGVSRLSIGPSGSLSDRQLLVEMPGAIPDGVAYDRHGQLLISCWTPDAIYRWDGSQLDLLALDHTRFVLNQPTNIAFVPGTSQLVAANVGDRFLSLLEHEHVGAPLHRPLFRCREGS
jgi:sugar lactone lactonase YvrE